MDSLFRKTIGLHCWDMNYGNKNPKKKQNYRPKTKKFTYFLIQEIVKKNRHSHQDTTLSHQQKHEMERYS